MFNSLTLFQNVILITRPWLSHHCTGHHAGLIHWWWCAHRTWSTGVVRFHGYLLRYIVPKCRRSMQRKCKSLPHQPNLWRFNVWCMLECPLHKGQIVYFVPATRQEESQCLVGFFEFCLYYSNLFMGDPNASSFNWPKKKKGLSSWSWLQWKFYHMDLMKGDWVGSVMRQIKILY